MFTHRRFTRFRRAICIKTADEQQLLKEGWIVSVDIGTRLFQIVKFKIDTFDLCGISSPSVFITTREFANNKLPEDYYSYEYDFMPVESFEKYFMVIDEK